MLDTFTNTIILEEKEMLYLVKKLGLIHIKQIRFGEGKLTDYFREGHEKIWTQKMIMEQTFNYGWDNKYFNFDTGEYEERRNPLSTLKLRYVNWLHSNGHDVPKFTN